MIYVLLLLAFVVFIGVLGYIDVERQLRDFEENSKEEEKNSEEY